MADNTKIWPIFRWANWGLSDDLFTGIQNSFYYSKNLEIREDMRSIYPCPQAKIETTVTWTPTKILQYDSDKRAVFSNSSVYVFDSDDSSVTSPVSLGGKVCDAEIFGDKIFVTSYTALVYLVQTGLTQQLLLIWLLVIIIHYKLHLLHYVYEIRVR